MISRKEWKEDWDGLKERSLDETKEISSFRVYDICLTFAKAFCFSATQFFNVSFLLVTARRYFSVSQPMWLTSRA